MTEAEKFLVEHGFDPANMGDFDFSMRTLDSFKLRDAYLSKFGFAVLTRGAVKALQPYGPMVEVGAGSGYWAHELKQAGVDIVATEPFPGQRGRYRVTPWTLYTDMEKLTALEAVKKYSMRTLLTVWPDYDNPWVPEMLKAYAGPCVIYVGESPGGCTGNDEFHDYLERAFKKVKGISIPKFPGIHDWITIWKRRDKILDK